MKIYNLIILFLLTFCGIKSYAQDVKKEQLLNKFWVMNKYELSKVEETDTLTIHLKSNKEEALKTPYGHGFILNIDGTFEEILKRNCGQDRLAHKGNWTYINQTLTMNVKGTLWVQMKLIEQSESNLISTSWKFK